MAKKVSDSNKNNSVAASLPNSSGDICPESSEINEKASEFLKKAEESNVEKRIEPLIEASANATKLFDGIINSSFDYLNSSKSSKIKMRWFQAIFSWCFIVAQFIIFTILIFVLRDNNLGLIISFASEMIVQMIGLLVIMIKNTFDDKNERQVIGAITDITSTYSKTTKNLNETKRK